jgi:hypothetical protein
MNDNATTKQNFMTWFIRIIPMTFSQCTGSVDRKAEHSREVGGGKSQSLKRAAAKRLIVLTA